MSLHFRINLGSKGYPVYSDVALTKRIGTIAPRELYVYRGSDMVIAVSFYSPTGWEKIGYIASQPVSAAAYKPEYKYGQYVGDYAFKVAHRQTRIFSGKNVVAAVQPGGYIITDGHSGAGSEHPDRLSIKGYIPAGGSINKPRYVTDGWCDTDINIGKSMYNTITIDGLWV